MTKGRGLSAHSQLDRDILELGMLWFDIRLAYSAMGNTKLQRDTERRWKQFKHLCDQHKRKAEIAS